MRKVFVFFGFALLSASVLHAQQFGTFKDTRDRKVYTTVRIGKQVWMATNLDVAVFRNGDTIPQVKTAEEWIRAGQEGKPAWCYNENNPAIGLKFAKLYNWYAVADPRGLAPNGWHVSMKSDWEYLKSYLGEGDEWTAAWKLRSNKGWQVSKGSNTTGFSALPGGKRDETGKFESDFEEKDLLGYWGHWWNRTDYSTSDACFISLNGGAMDGGYIGFYTGSKIQGMAVRCVKD